MTGQHTYSGNYKPIVAVTIAGFALATLFCELGRATARGCNLLDKAGWVALEVLRMVILLADWQAALAYLCEDSRLWQHLLQIGASICPLLCVVAG
jgi:apolipoprotein N-acyltransferase